MSTVELRQQIKDLIAGKIKQFNCDSLKPITIDDALIELGFIVTNTEFDNLKLTINREYFSSDLKTVIYFDSGCYKRRNILWRND